MGMLHMDELSKNNINKTASVDSHQSTTMKIIF